MIAGPEKARITKKTVLAACLKAVLHATRADALVADGKPVTASKPPAPVRAATSAGIEDVGRFPCSATGTMLAGIVDARRLFNVDMQTAIAIAEVKFRILPLRPPPGPISSWDRSGNVEVVMETDPTMPIAKAPMKSNAAV